MRNESWEGYVGPWRILGYVGPWRIQPMHPSNPGKEGCIRRPHLKDPWNWDSTWRVAVTQSASTHPSNAAFEGCVLGIGTQPKWLIVPEGWSDVLWSIGWPDWSRPHTLLAWLPNPPRAPLSKWAVSQFLGRILRRLHSKDASTPIASQRRAKCCPNSKGPSNAAYECSLLFPDFKDASAVSFAAQRIPRSFTAQRIPPKIHCAVNPKNKTIMAENVDLTFSFKCKYLVSSHSSI